MDQTSIGSSIPSQTDKARNRVGLALVAFAAAAAIFGAQAARQSAPAAAETAAPPAATATAGDAADTTEFYREHYGAVTPGESVAAYDR